MCLAILINFVIIYYSSKKFAQPLKQMSDAARVIAGGDFEKRLNINTDDEIGDLANSFNEMAQSLFFQEKRRREFISNISHDLRSPLTSMKGFLQAILDGTVPADKQDHYLQIVLDESERLVKMANDMLDINKLDDSENSLNLSKFNLNSLITKTLLNFEGRALENKIKVTCKFSNENIVVHADYDKIQRVIYNLVDNALKFTHKYGYIIVSATVIDKKVSISVKDNGKGISANEQKMVFDRLYKGDKSRGKDKKGSGLGLSIVKEFIKAHNEEITLKSEMGKGCTFTFTLPFVSKGDVINNE
jgi:signal transduction histidine kinase